MSPGRSVLRRLAGVVTVLAATAVAAAQDARILNLSARATTQVGDGAVIAGFVVSTPTPRPVLVRAIGPSLAGFNVTGALSAAQLTLFRDGASLASNAGWAGAPAIAATAAQVGAFAIDPASLDAALLMDLPSGAYTAVATPASGAAPGIVLIEIYDAGSAFAGGLVNVSTRANAGPSEEALITGFVLAGSGQQQVLVRGAGPVLSSFGVAGALANPQLVGFRGGDAIASNDDWIAAAELVEATASLGAFPFPAASKDASLLLTLPAGAYTAQVQGLNASRGVALVETYARPVGRTLIADDRFDRSGANWGRPPQDLAWSGMGSLLQPGRLFASANNRNNAVLVRSLLHTEGIVVTPLPEFGASAGALARVTSTGSASYAYELRRVNGQAELALFKIVNLVATPLGSPVIVDAVPPANAVYHLRFVAAGSAPTHLRAKAWRSDVREPAGWHISSMDSEAALQVAGNSGLTVKATVIGNLTHEFRRFSVHEPTMTGDLRTAMTTAYAGDIIYFTGTHTGNMKTARSGRADAPIIVRGFDATVRTASQTTGWGVEVLNDHWHFDGFTIDFAKKGFYAFNADHGLLSAVHVTRTGQEAFKFRRYSNHWEVASCSAAQTGQEAQDYGEGFYVGDARSNWESTDKPDTSGNIVFRDCTTRDTTNDGFDIKEGAHHVKFIRCGVDFTGIAPVGGAARGDSGFYLRADDLQLIDCEVTGQANGSSAYNVANLADGANDFGNRISFKAVHGTNLTANTALFEIQSTRSDGIVIYDDYISTNVARFKAGSGSHTTPPASTFVELVW